MASENNVYVSIMGIGLDFNTEITEAVTKNEGCNYFSATKNE